MPIIANTPEPPYYAVIFTSVRTAGDHGYSAMSDLMVNLASAQEGFLGVESARNEVGITVSYWRDLPSITKWRNHVDHKYAQQKGRENWYNAFKARIALVERDYGFLKK